MRASRRPDVSKRGNPREHDLFVFHKNRPPPYTRVEIETLYVPICGQAGCAARRHGLGEKYQDSVRSRRWACAVLAASIRHLTHLLGLFALAGYLPAPAKLREDGQPHLFHAGKDFLYKGVDKAGDELKPIL